MQTHHEWLDGVNEPTKHEKRVLAFEKAAKKKGYSFDKDDVDRYEDNWLQEAWEIFSLIDLKSL
jgi:hypothetical protein